MRRVWLLPLLMCAAHAEGRQPQTKSGAPLPVADAQQQPESLPPIIVTGLRLSDTRRALEQCIARNCPPNEDVDASLAHAENLFVAGDYKEARRTLNAAVGRNRRHAKAYPVPVADLYRADARVAAHLGEKKEYKWSTWETRRSLQAGLPEGDPRLIGADLEIADMQAATNNHKGARRSYRRAGKKAREIGRPDLAAIAGMRLAWLTHLEGGTAAARRALGEIAARRDPAVTISRLAALVLLARLDRKDGRLGTSDALIEELRAAGLRKPALLYAPPIMLDEGVARRDDELVSGNDFEDRWVDVGFWVGADGQVSEIELLRESGPTGWTNPVLASIAGRIYSPVSAEIGGSYRVERYTYTAWWDVDRRSFTRIRQREPNAQIKFLDLTVEPPGASN